MMTKTRSGLCWRSKRKEIQVPEFRRNPGNQESRKGTKNKKRSRTRKEFEEEKDKEAGGKTTKQAKINDRLNLKQRRGIISPIFHVSSLDFSSLFIFPPPSLCIFPGFLVSWVPSKLPSFSPLFSLPCVSDVISFSLSFSFYSFVFSWFLGFLGSY